MNITQHYNTILTAYGISTIKVSGYTKKITENNIQTRKKIDIENENDNDNENMNKSGKHAWTLAKIDGEWVPLDATWKLFDKHVPITHVFQYYGNSGTNIKSSPNNKVKKRLVKENIKYNKN